MVEYRSAFLDVVRLNLALLIITGNKHIFILLTVLFKTRRIKIIFFKKLLLLSEKNKLKIF